MCRCIWGMGSFWKALILLDVLCTSWIWSLVSDINFGIFSVIISSDLFLFLLSVCLLLLLFPRHITFVAVPQFPGYSNLVFPFPVFFLFLLFLSRSFYGHILKVKYSVLSHVLSTNEPIFALSQCFDL